MTGSTTARPTVQLSKTSFQKYVELKSLGSRLGLKYKTATSTPSNMLTGVQFDSFDIK